MIESKISTFKIIGTIGLVIMLLMYLLPTCLGIYKGIQTGDMKASLNSSGGGLFVADHTIKSETNFLLENKADNNYSKAFHFTYIISLIATFIILLILFYKLANWAIGAQAFNPLVDVLILLFGLLILFSLQFVYSYAILDSKALPFSGIVYFIKNLPQIITILIS
jgi:hypothetical protein